MPQRGDEFHRAGVRPRLVVTTRYHQFDGLPDFEIIQGNIDDRVAMKKDLSAIVGLDEAVILDRKEAIDLALQWNVVGFNVAA